MGTRELPTVRAPVSKSGAEPERLPPTRFNLPRHQPAARLPLRPGEVEHRPASSNEKHDGSQESSWSRELGLPGQRSICYVGRHWPDGQLEAQSRHLPAAQRPCLASLFVRLPSPEAPVYGTRLPMRPFHWVPNVAMCRSQTVVRVERGGLAEFTERFLADPEKEPENWTLRMQEFSFA